MKKVCSLLLAVLFVLSLSACGKEGDEKTNSNSDSLISSVSDTLDDNISNVESIADTSSENNSSSDKPSSSIDASNVSSSSTTSTSAHTHTYSKATCTTPSVCQCGATNGNALGHKWSDATCKTPKRCSVCGLTEGSATAHSYNNGVCSVCGAKDPNYKYTELKDKKGGWVMFHECEDGTCVCRFYFSLYDSNELYFGGDICTLYDPWPECPDKFEYKGKSYCIDLSDYDKLESIKEENGIITIHDWFEEHKVQLKRTGENTLTVVNCDEEFSISSGMCGCALPEGAIFTFTEGKFPW